MLSVIGIAVVLGLGVYHSNASQMEPTLSSEEIKELVTSQYPGTITELELAKSEKKAIYLVKLTNDGMEYELKMDGHSGEVITLKENYIAAKDRSSQKETMDLDEEKKQEDDTEQQNKEEQAAQEEADRERDKQEQEELAQAEKEREEQEQAEKEKDEHETKIAKQEQQDKQDESKKQKETSDKTEKNPKKQQEQKQAVIDINKAINIALEQFPGVVEEVELEEEDGRLIYEIEIEGDGEEAEFEIDAYTGEIIVIEIEDD